MPRTRRAILMSATAIVLSAAVPALAKKKDYDCADFPTQKKAQKFFKKHGGPKKDKYGLDSDRDGKACEELD